MPYKQYALTVISEDERRAISEVLSTTKYNVGYNSIKSHYALKTSYF